MASRTRDRGPFYNFGQRVRRRAVAVAIAFALGAALFLRFRATIFNWLLEPAGDSLSPFDGKPIYTTPTEMLWVTILMMVGSGLVVAAPVLIGSVFTLIRGIFSVRTQAYTLGLLTLAFSLFYGGVFFVYFVVMPNGLGFLLNFDRDIAVALISINAYLSLIVAMMFWVGVAFQLPLVMHLAAKIPFIPLNYRRFKRFRLWFIPTAFFFGAIITPTFDPVNSTLIALPMIGLYEIGLLGAWLAHPDEANYLWIKSIWRRIAWVLSRPSAMFWKAAGLTTRLTFWIRP